MTFTFHPFAGAALRADFYHFWLVGSNRRRNHPCQTLSWLVKGLGGYGYPKSGVFHWLWMSLLQQCYALTCYTVSSHSTLNCYVYTCMKTNKNTAFWLKITILLRANSLQYIILDQSEFLLLSRARKLSFFYIEKHNLLYTSHAFSLPHRPNRNRPRK